MQQIWSLKSNGASYAYLSLINEDDAEILKNIKGIRSIQAWKPLAVEILDEENYPLSDFPLLSPGLLVCSTHSLEIIKPFLKDVIEILPLQCEKGKFFLLNILNVQDCLDREKSDIEYFTSGNINRINRYAFKSNCLDNAPLFKIPERIKGNIYASDAFKALIEANGLTGLTFTKIWEVD